MSDREDQELDKYERKMKFELEEALDILTTHVCNKIIGKNECCILDSYPLSMTLIKCENEKEKLSLIIQLREFSRMVKGSYWIILEDNKDNRNLTMLEFFNYNDGTFRNKTNEILKENNEIDILNNYFTHSDSILNMNNKNEILDDRSITTTLRRRRDYDYSRKYLGLAFNNSILNNNEKLRNFDGSSLVFVIKINDIKNTREFLKSLEDIYQEHWLNKEEESFLTILSFNIDKKFCEDINNDDFDNIELESNKDIFLIHIFNDAAEYALVTSTLNWTNYMISIRDINLNKHKLTFITQKLIYNSLDNFDEMNIFRLKNKKYIDNKDNINIMDNKSSTTKCSSTDSCRLIDNSNGFSSTDLDSITTSINSSTENLALTDINVKKSNEIIEEIRNEMNQKDIESEDIENYFEDESIYNIDKLLISNINDADFWESALIDEKDLIAISNIRKKNNTMNLNNKIRNPKLFDNKEFTTFQDTIKEEEFYECRKMKFETFELKAKLARLIMNNNKCDDQNCIYCYSIQENNIEKNVANGLKISDFSVWCKEGFKNFCEIYKSMGIVNLTRKTDLNYGKKAWLIREFIGDELSDLSFCDGVNRKKGVIKGDLRSLEVYLVGDFNNWNKTSHPMLLETENICKINQELFENYPSIPYFMKNRIYSIVLDESKLENFIESNNGYSSFRIRIVTSNIDNCREGNNNQELETYRLLSYSRSLISSGIKDSTEHSLMNCLLNFNSQQENDIKKLKYPLPRCLLKSSMESTMIKNLCNDQIKRFSNINILKELISNMRQLPLYIYEANIGFSSFYKGQIGTYNSFKDRILPRISRGGYNCLLLTGILEHYQSFNNSQYPFNYFTLYSKYGNIEEFKDLVGECHRRGIMVLIDFNLTFGDITSSNSLLQPCDREVNNNLGNLQNMTIEENSNEMSEKGMDINNNTNTGDSFINNNKYSNNNNINDLFIDESIIDLYESFMLTNLNTVNPSFFKHTPDVISSLFAYNKNYSRLNLGYIPMLSLIMSSIHYLMTYLGIDGFRFTVPDLSEEKEKYSYLSSILALINDTVHSIKPYGITIANELLLRGNKEKACSELSIPIEYGGMGFDYIWNISICTSLQDIILKNPSNLNLKKDIVDELLPYEDKMRNSNKKILILNKNKMKNCNEKIENISIKQRNVDSGNLHTIEFVAKNLYGIESLETKSVTQNPLRIAMFSWESLYTHLVGGVSPHVSELSASLVRLGHEVHVFTRATTSTYLIKVHDGVLYHECPFQLNSDFVTEITNMCNSFVYHMQRWEDGLTKVPDNPSIKNVKNGYRFNICHCHDWLAAPVLTSLRRIGNNNRTTIFTIHSTEYGRCGNQNFGGQSSRISDIEREGCHTADRLICVSGALAEEVCRLFGVNRNKIKVIYNGIHCQAFDRVVMNDAGEIKRQYNIGPLEPTFLCVARMALQKGVDLLIEAVPGILKYRSDTKFIFVGDGHQKDEIVRRSHQLGIYNSVRFVGKKSGDDVIRLYKACDAVVVPSRNEPFGIVVLEGWSASKPVVATTSGGPRDFLTPNVDGYLVEPCKDSIAWGCCEILKNFDHSRWMGSRGRVKAAYSFSWDSIARITSYLYFEQCNILDVAPSLMIKPNSPIILQTFGENALYHHMTIFDSFDRSVYSLKQIKLLILTMMAFAKNGIFQSMGSEFGNPDSFDYPRPNNNMDITKFCCRWDLADDKNLKFKHIELFNTLLIRLEKFLNWTIKLNTNFDIDQNKTIKNNISTILSSSSSSLSSPLSSLSIPSSSYLSEKMDDYPTNNTNKKEILNSNSRSDNIVKNVNNSKNSTDCETISFDNINNKELDTLMKNCSLKNNGVDIDLDKNSIQERDNDPFSYSLYSSSNIRIILCHELDKVLIIERNYCTFIFNYSDKYYTNYGFGITNEYPQSIVIDTQDERFGGEKKYIFSDKNNNCFNPNKNENISVLKSVAGFNILNETKESGNNKSRQDFQKFDSESPYRFINIQLLKQTIFLNIAPYSAYVLAPSDLVQDFPCETIGDKLFNETIDNFVDSINLFS